MVLCLSCLEESSYVCLCSPYWSQSVIGIWGDGDDRAQNQKGTCMGVCGG